MGIMPNALIVGNWHTEKLELKKNLVIEIWDQEKESHNLSVVIAVHKDFVMRVKMMIDFIGGAMLYGKLDSVSNELPSSDRWLNRNWNTYR